jgi:methylated-DNA-[protein]-cysteine S-methyltransferase
MKQKSIDSPLGRLKLVATDTALIGVYFPEHRRAPQLQADLVTHHPILDAAEAELRAYFQGTRRTFATPLSAAGTDFQQRVWRALAQIPYGQRRTYAELAASLGMNGAARAVGSANAMNPLSIFVPCHRVIGASGSLSGYAGGVSAKQWLLEHEQRQRAAA